jgi:hypothetical protein
VEKFQAGVIFIFDNFQVGILQINVEITGLLSVSANSDSDSSPEQNMF